MTLKRLIKEFRDLISSERIVKKCRGSKVSISTIPLCEGNYEFAIHDVGGTYLYLKLIDVHTLRDLDVLEFADSLVRDEIRGRGLMLELKAGLGIYLKLKSVFSEIDKYQSDVLNG